MKATKVKFYDAERYFIGETTIEIPSDVTVLSWGPEFFIRSADHENCFALAIGIALKNGEVAL